MVATSTTFVLANEKVSRRSGQIRLHGPEDFAAMRKAGALTAEALDLIGPLVKPGVTTASLDRFAFEFARDHDAYPASLNYRGYRKYEDIEPFVKDQARTEATTSITATLGEFTGESEEEVKSAIHRLIAELPAKS